MFIAVKILASGFELQLSVSLEEVTDRAELHFQTNSNMQRFECWQQKNDECVFCEMEMCVLTETVWCRVSAGDWWWIKAWCYHTQLIHHCCRLVIKSHRHTHTGGKKLYRNTKALSVYMPYHCFMSFHSETFINWSWKGFAHYRISYLFNTVVINVA